MPKWRRAARLGASDNKEGMGGGTLDEVELDTLAEFLGKAKGGKAMNLEALDGFFAALIAGPEVVPPSEYLPEVFGGDMSQTCEFTGIDQANEILGLMMRHWNTIAATLKNGDVHLPILLEDRDDVSQGGDWAHGFMRGIEMRRTSWAELFGDDEHSGCLVPVLMLYHEHDEDPELRPGPIEPAKREEIIVHMAAGIVRAYRYFRSHRPRAGRVARGGPYSNRRKIGRNEPCPCGSGKKHKRCCGAATVH